jgi:predicted nucleic acid-binding protein
MTERIFLDTAFAQALLNRRDHYHEQAKALFPRIRVAQEVWLTEAILVEIGNALAATNRAASSQFIQQCYQTVNMRIVPVTTDLLQRALALYADRPDKLWGLTDCISFVVMRDEGVVLAATADRHFAQAGFQPLLF